MPVTLLGCTDHQTHTTLQQQQQQRRSGAESNNKERSGGVHCYRAAGSRCLRCPDSPTISIFLFHIQEETDKIQTGNSVQTLQSDRCTVSLLNFNHSSFRAELELLFTISQSAEAVLELLLKCKHAKHGDGA